MGKVRRPRPTYSITFYCRNSSNSLQPCRAGSVYYVDETCRLKRQFVAEAGIKKLLHYDDKNVLVTVTTSMMLSLHTVSDGGETSETMKVTEFCSSTNYYSQVYNHIFKVTGSDFLV